MWRNWDVVNVRSLVYTIQNSTSKVKITNPILTMVVKFNPHQITAKTIEVGDREKIFLRDGIRPPSRTRYISNHILKVKGSLKKSIFWMKKLHFWISTPMWRVAKMHFFSSKNDFFSKSIGVVLKPFRRGNKTPKSHQIH